MYAPLNTKRSLPVLGKERYFTALLKHFQPVFLGEFFLDKPVNNFINCDASEVNGYSIAVEKTNAFFHNAFRVPAAEYGVVFGNERRVISKR